MNLITATSLTRFLDVFNFKKIIEKSLNNPPRNTKPVRFSRLAKHFLVTQFQLMEKTVVTLQPNVLYNNFHILFFHGGAYLLEGNAQHWKLIESIALKASCRISYIDYPLAPENTYKSTFDMVQHSYNMLVAKYPTDIFMLMGDSAGGGLALAFAQKLAAENASIQPTKIILFSPWLDMKMENSEIKKIEKLDKILSVDALRKAATLYSGGDDLSHYLLSPINGNFEGLGQTLVFYGTHEILYPDCLKLKEKTAQNSNFHFHEFAGMQHDWVIFPIAEADEALEMAVEFIVR